MKLTCQYVSEDTVVSSHNVLLIRLCVALGLAAGITGCESFAKQIPPPTVAAADNNCQMRVGYGNVQAAGGAGFTASGYLDGSVLTVLGSDACPKGTYTFPHPRDMSRTIEFTID